MDGDAVASKGELAEASGDIERWRASHLLLFLLFVVPCEDVMEEERWKPPDIRKEEFRMVALVATTDTSD